MKKDSSKPSKSPVIRIKPKALPVLLRHKRIIQLAEYLVGGGVYFWTGLAVFSFCYSVLHWHWLIAKGLADIIGWTLNYLIQRYWAFNDKGLNKYEGRVRFRYILINAIDLVFDYGIVGGLKLIGITPYFSFFVSAAFTTVWDYLWYRFWVFKPSI